MKSNLPLLSLLFKTLGDEARLSIIRGLSEKDLYAEVLAERLSLSPATVTFHLKKLEKVGLVTSRKEQYYKVFSLRRDMLNHHLLELIQSVSHEKEDRLEDKYRQKVIKSFFKNGQLKDIPVQRKKRRIILEHLVSEFEEDRKYGESEVNEVIERYHPDFCTIRREFIAEKLMTRSQGQYQRL